MKKQDNESLIQELTKRLDWYIMKASDEEFDADEVQTLMKLLDNLKTERNILIYFIIKIIFISIKDIT